MFSSCLQIYRLIIPRFAALKKAFVKILKKINANFIIINKFLVANTV